MSFQQLCWAATVVKEEKDPLHLVHEWSAKRNTLVMQLLDLPQLVADVRGRRVKKYVLPSFDLDAQLTAAKREADGFPLMQPDGRFEVETITVREYLVKGGVEVPPAPPPRAPAPAEQTSAVGAASGPANTPVTPPVGE